jgi:peptidyl-prolyl cis-trans isomerase D
MLDIMRRQKRLKLILWFVILGLALGMLLFFVPGGNMGSNPNDGPAATVDGKSISMRQYLDDYRRISYRLRDSKNPMNAEALKAELPQGLLNNLILGKLRESLAKKFGIEVTPAEVRQAIQSSRDFQYQGQFIGVLNYRARLADAKMTTEEFEEDIYQRLLDGKLRAILTDSLDVTDREVREEFSRTNQKTQVDYVLLKKDAYRKRVKPTEAELQSYFEAHKEQYRIMEKRRAQFLVIPSGQFLTGLPVSDEEIRTEWSKWPHTEIIHTAQILFKVPAEDKDAAIKAKAEEILKRAKAGEDFSALATKYSEDPQSAGRGGIMSPFPQGAGITKEFDETAFSLKPGEISKPVRTPQGYHIIKVLKRVTPTMESQRAALISTVQAHKAIESAKQKAEEAVQLLEKQKDLNQVINNLGAKGVKAVIKEIPPIMKTDQPYNFSISQPMRDAIFDLKESNPIGKAVLSNEGYAVPKLIEVQSPKLSDFATSRSKVEPEYAEAKSKELLMADAQKLSAEATKQGSLEKAAKGMGLSVKKSQEFDLSGTPDPEIGANTPFNKAAFELEPGGVSAPQLIYETNVAVFQVKSRTPFDESAYQNKKGEFKNKLLQSLREPYFQDYIQKIYIDLQKADKIYVNPKATEQALKSYY